MTFQRAWVKTSAMMGLAVFRHAFNKQVILSFRSISL